MLCWQIFNMGCFSIASSILLQLFNLGSCQLCFQFLSFFFLPFFIAQTQDERGDFFCFFKGKARENYLIFLVFKKNETRPNCPHPTVKTASPTSFFRALPSSHRLPQNRRRQTGQWGWSHPRPPWFEKQAATGQFLGMGLSTEYRFVMPWKKWYQ